MCLPIGTATFRMEVASLKIQRMIIIQDKDRDWWDDKLGNGFFDMLEEEELPVVVKVGVRSICYGGGLPKKTALHLYQELFHKQFRVRG